MASGTGESFFSVRVDDPSLAAPLDVALFRPEDGSYNVSWRRPHRKRDMLAAGNDGGLPPMPPAEPEDGHTPDQPTGGDGLGESAAPGPKTSPRGKRQELETA